MKAESLSLGGKLRIAGATPARARQRPQSNTGLARALFAGGWQGTCRDLAAELCLPLDTAQKIVETLRRHLREVSRDKQGSVYADKGGPRP
jgi:hypothetical protein